MQDQMQGHTRSNFGRSYARSSLRSYEDRAKTQEHQHQQTDLLQTKHKPLTCFFFTKDDSYLSDL